MTRIILDGADIRKDVIAITGQDSAHVCLSLRMKPGEPIIICDGSGNDAYCEIIKAGKEETDCRVLEIKPCTSELPARVFIYQSLPKGDKLEFIIQKATELGAAGVIPVLSERCISRPDKAAFEKKLVRYRGIAKEAAQQCGRGVIPAVSGLVDFRCAVSSLPASDIKIFCYEKEKDNTLKAALSGFKSGTAHIFTGAEGGFSDGEKALADSFGLTSVTFGERILRCETAPLYVLSAISYELS